MSTRTWRILPVAVSIATLCACGGAQTEPSSTPTSASREDATMTTDPPARPGSDLPRSTVTDEVAQRPEVRAAIEDLAQRRSVATGAVTISGYADVTWSDGSLGCPQPGVQYTQALVPGRQLVLRVDGEQFSYHAGRKGTFSFCATPQPPASTGDGST